MPAEVVPGLRHVGDQRRRLVVAPRMGTEMNELACVEMIGHPFDHLPHGDAATCADIVSSAGFRRRQQAREKLGDVGRANEIPNLAAICHVDRCTSGQCSQ